MPSRLNPRKLNGRQGGLRSCQLHGWPTEVVNVALTIGSIVRSHTDIESNTYIHCETQISETVPFEKARLQELICQRTRVPHCHRIRTAHRRCDNGRILDVSVEVGQSRERHLMGDCAVIPCHIAPVVFGRGDRM